MRYNALTVVIAGRGGFAVIRKLVAWGIAVVAAFYLVVAPTSAGSVVKHAGTSLQHAAHQVAVFLKTVG